MNGSTMLAQPKRSNSSCSRVGEMRRVRSCSSITSRQRSRGFEDRAHGAWIELRAGGRIDAIFMVERVVGDRRRQKARGRGNGRVQQAARLARAVVPLAARVQDRR